MPKFQKESFFKSFMLFFILIELLLSFIFYTNFKVELEHLKSNIFLEMKNYSYNFDGNKFDMILEDKNKQKLYELQNDKKNFYIYVDINNQELIKIIYDKKNFYNDLKKIQQKLLFEFCIFSLVSLVISILFSFYSLYPLQKSYTILKEFIKDIIHDINTPISSIKLNLTLIENKNDEVLAIEQSINTLTMLHKNLDNYLNDTPINIFKYNIKDILEEQIYFFKSIYDYLDWQIEIEDELIMTDRYVFERVIYNLLNNSCKYNTSNGFIRIEYKNKLLNISNSSYGIKNQNKVFNRFYKESDRGLGIGLHIVAKLLSQLKYHYNLQVDTNNVVIISITIK